MQSIIVHIMNEEPIVGEADPMPDGDSQFVTLSNPRRKDGKELHYLDEGVTKMLIPWHRVNFVQFLPSGDAEEIIGFVRE